MFPNTKKNLCLYGQTLSYYTRKEIPSGKSGLNGEMGVKMGGRGVLAVTVELAEKLTPPFSPSFRVGEQCMACG